MNQWNIEPNHSWLVQFHFRFTQFDFWYVFSFFFFGRKRAQNSLGTWKVYKVTICHLSFSLLLFTLKNLEKLSLSTSLPLYNILGLQIQLLSKCGTYNGYLKQFYSLHAGKGNIDTWFDNYSALSLYIFSIFAKYCDHSWKVKYKLPRLHAFVYQKWWSYVLPFGITKPSKETKPSYTKDHG